jgi:hypothetical protein
MADETNKNLPTNDQGNDAPDLDGEENMDGRLERLGGEPAPVITPEEFARLQKAGQVHIDARGRVRTASRSGPNAGVSLRKRRAWYVR